MMSGTRSGKKFNSRPSLSNQQNSSVALSQDYEDKLVERIMYFVGAKIEEYLKKTIEPLKQKISDLEGDLEEMVYKLDSLEQQNKYKKIRIYGITSETDGNIVQITTEILKEKLDIELSTSDFLSCYQINKPRAANNAKRNCIIAELVHSRKKDEIYKNKKKLKNTGIIIKEDLTAMRFNLMNKCIVKFGKNNVWTTSGKIHVWDGNKKLVIETNRVLEEQ